MQGSGYATVASECLYRMNEEEELGRRIQALEGQLTAAREARNDALAEARKWRREFDVLCEILAAQHPDPILVWFREIVAAKVV